MHSCGHRQGVTRREMIQAGAIGLLGLGMNHVSALQALGANTAPKARAKKVIYIFLSGGLAQHESFDMKPDAPVEYRGEFKPIATRTPGIQICEHLPMLAQRSNKWALVRSLTHGTNDHSLAHHVMLTGRRHHSDLIAASRSPRTSRALHRSPPLCYRSKTIYRQPWCCRRR